MGTILFSHKGNFEKTFNFLNNVKNKKLFNLLDKYGQMGVNALSAATPVDTGKTSQSWYYETSVKGDTATIQWLNSNVNHGVNIAVILQFGHATRNGGYVTGIDYINPALKPVFDEISEKVWKEVEGS